MSLVAIEPNNCPMWRLAGFILRAADVVEKLPDDEADVAHAETMAPAWSEFFTRPPAIQSPEGTIAALRALILSEELDEGCERVVASVLAFLDAERSV